MSPFPLADLVRQLRKRNLFERAMFSFTGDHGLTPVVDDTLHAMVLETPLNEEIEDIFEAAGFNVLDNQLEELQNVDAVMGFNGGMAHIYVRNRGDGSFPMPPWYTYPSYTLEIIPLAQRFYDNSVGLLSDDTGEGILGGIELILVRNPEAQGFYAPYLVMYRSASTTGAWTYATTQQALSVTLNGKPLVPTGYVDFVKNIDRLRDPRSGDIILLANYTQERTGVEPDGTGVWTAGGYYFGGDIPGWHGSLYNTDMTIPILFSFPNGAGGELQLFLATVNQKIPAIPGDPPRITDITAAALKVLTGEEY